MDLSCCTSILKPKPVDEALATLAEAGFKLVECSRCHLDGRFSCSQLDAHGLKLWALHGGLTGGAISFDETERDAAVCSEIDKMRELAAFAPCPYVVHYLSRSNNPAVGDVYTRSIKQLLECAEGEGFVLAVETAPYKPEVNERYPDSAEIAAFVRSFDSPSLKICVDLNHSNLHENLEAAILNCAGQIATTHVSDNNADREEHLMPGQGGIEFARALGALEGAGYGGPFNFEVSGKQERTLEEITALREWGERLISDGNKKGLDK